MNSQKIYIITEDGSGIIFEAYIYEEDAYQRADELNKETGFFYSILEIKLIGDFIN